MALSKILTASIASGVLGGDNPTYSSISPSVATNDATDITLEQYKDIEQSRKKQPDLPVVGTAITYEEVKARNKAIVHHRINAENKLTLQQLGTMYNITRERVRQIQDRHEVSSKTLKQTNEEKHAS